MSSTVPAAPESSAPLEDPLIGLQVGEYRILEPIGEGGMGVVYRGMHPVIKKRVAIKVIKPAHASDESQVKRLVAEAEAVNAIGHRAIIDIFSLGALPDGRPYIIMEYLDGEPLDVWLGRQGRPPLSVALELLVEMCGPLAAAHRAGVIHRDLKPSNIFLVSQPDGSKFLKLLDFGLAKRAMGLDGSSAQTSQAMVSGTPDYMAPEQARALPISPRSDIYALGVVAFELLTGQVPFMGATPMDVMVGHVSKPAPRLRTFEPSLPEALDALVARMLAKEPEARPQTIEEVRTVLEDVLVAGGDAPPRPSQTNLPRLTGLEAPRPSAPPPAAALATPLPAEPLALPEPLPLVVGTSLESSQVAPAEVVLGTPIDSRPMLPVPPPAEPLLTPLAVSTHAPQSSAPRPARSQQTPASNPSLRVRPATPSGSAAVRSSSQPSMPAQAPASNRGLLVGAAVGGALVLLVLGLWLGGAFGGEDAPEAPLPTPAPLPTKQPPPDPPTPDGPASPDVAPGTEPEAVDVAPTPASPDIKKATPTPKKRQAPSAEVLLKRIARLEGVAKKKNLGPSATSLLDAYRLEVTAAESASAREALGRKLDGWEDAFLGK